MLRRFNWRLLTLIVLSSALVGWFNGLFVSPSVVDFSDAELTHSNQKVDAPNLDHVQPAKPGHSSLVGDAKPNQAIEGIEQDASFRLAPDQQYDLDPVKIASMRDARINGDSRAPKITPRTEFRVKPTEEELANPDLYLEYEARNTLQVYSNYVAAAQQKIHQLEIFMAQARAKGASEEDLREGVEKIEQLKAMALKLEAEHDLPPAQLTHRQRNTPTSDSP